MKTYYIQAVVYPKGIEQVMEFGLLVTADSLTDGLVTFQEHYEAQWGVGITYTVTQVVDVENGKLV